MWQLHLNHLTSAHACAFNNNLITRAHAHFTIPILQLSFKLCNLFLILFCNRKKLNNLCLIYYLVCKSEAICYNNSNGRHGNTK